MSDLIITIGARTKEFDAELKAVENSVKELDARLSQVAKVSGAVFAATAASAAIAINEFAKFDNTLRATRALLDENAFAGQTLDEGFKEMSADLLALGARSGQDLGKLNKALFDIVSSGIAAGDAIKVTEAAARLAVTGITDVAIASDGLTNAINAYGLSAEDAEQISAKFFLAQKFGKTTVEELARGFGLVAASAAASGVSFEELLASVAAVTSAGVRTNAAYTGLKAVIANVAKPTQEAAEEARRLGINFDGAALRSQGLTKFLQNLTKANGFTRQSITKLFGSVEAQNIVFALAGNQAGLYAKVVNELGKESEAAATFSQAYEIQIESLTNKFGILATQATVLFIAIGERLAPAVAVFVDALTGAIDLVNKSEFLKDLIVNVGIAVGVISGLVATVASVGVAVLALLPILKGAAAVMAALGISVKLLVGATGLGLIVIIAATILQNWTAIWDAISGVLTDFFDFVSPLFASFGEVLSGIFSLDIGKIKSGLSGIAGFYIDTIKSIFGFGDKTAKASGDKAADNQIINAKKAADARKKIADKEAEEEKKRQEEAAAARQAELDRRNVALGAFSKQSLGGKIFGTGETAAEQRGKAKVDLGAGAETAIAFGATALETLASGAEGARAAVVSVLTAGAIAAFGPVGQQVGQIINLLSDPELPKKITGFLGAVPGVLKTIIDNALAKVVPAVVNSLPELVAAILSEVVPQFIEQLSEFPNVLIQSIIDNAGPIAQAIAEGVDDAMIAIVESAPAVFLANLGARLPELIKVLIRDIPPPLAQALAQSMTFVALGFSVEMIKLAPDIAKSFAQSLIIEAPGIARAIANAIAGAARGAASGAVSGGGGVGSLFGFAHGGVIGQDGPAFMHRGELAVPPRNFDEVVNSVAASRLADAPGAQSVTNNESRTQNFNFNGQLLQNDSFVNQMIAAIQSKIEFENARLAPA